MADTDDEDIVGSYYRRTRRYGTGSSPIRTLINPTKDLLRPVGVPAEEFPELDAAVDDLIARFYAVKRAEAEK